MNIWVKKKENKFNLIMMDVGVQKSRKKNDKGWVGCLCEYFEYLIVIYI